jgi:hypothetical protein
VVAQYNVTALVPIRGENRPEQHQVIGAGKWSSIPAHLIVILKTAYGGEDLIKQPCTVVQDTVDTVG